MYATTPFLSPEDPLYLPEGAGYLARFKVAVRAMTVLAKVKEHGIAAPVLNVSLDAEVFSRISEELRRTEEGQVLLRTRPNLQAGALDLEALHALPEGTLGKALARYYVDNGIEPFESPYPVRNDVDYLAKRYREVHDVVHVITGYGTDPVGELELQAFMFANAGLRQCLMIIAFAALLRPDGLPPVWRYADKLHTAYRLGRQCKDLVGPLYEDFWAASVEEVRQQLELAPQRVQS
jgi:ubiquinone biosynthesis protein COQ4